MAKVLLIGGTGIISTEICALAIERGHEVVIMNRGRRKESIHPKAEVIVADVRSSTVEELKKKIGNLSFDVIVDFLSYTPAHVQKTLDIIGDKCRQLIFISSATVYVNSGNMRYTEKCAIGNTKWEYALNKAKCEEYLAEHAPAYGLAYTIIRPYVTYGKTRIPLQIGPIEYYTIINRMKHNKPVPIYGKSVRCTLTTAKDFAVGAVGLFLNEKAYGEAFHITGSCETTWNQVLTNVAEKFGVKAKIVEIPEAVLKKAANKCGFDVDEILGDKGRNMLFDNSKIRSFVPEFTGATQFLMAIDEVVDYYTNNPGACKVNYAWDAKLDRLIAQIPVLYRGQRDLLRWSPYGKKCKGKDMITYIVNRYTILYYLMKCLHKIKRYLFTRH